MKMKKTASLYFSVALLSVLAALLLCFLGPTATPLLLWDGGDPVESAEQFLAALNGGDYAAAYEAAGAAELETMINDAVATARTTYGG